MCYLSCCFDITFTCDVVSKKYDSCQVYLVHITIFDFLYLRHIYILSWSFILLLWITVTVLIHISENETFFDPRIYTQEYPRMYIWDLGISQLNRGIVTNPCLLITPHKLST